MSDQMDLPGQELARVVDGIENVLPENLPGQSPVTRNPVAHEGSLVSHLLYGLGGLLLILPMLVPGIPMVWLSAAYGGLLVVLAAGLVAWSLAGLVKRRRSGPRAR